MKINELCYDERFDSFSGLITNESVRIPPECTIFGYVFDGVAEYRYRDRLKRVFAGSFFSADSKLFAEDKLRVFGKSFVSLMPGVRGHSIEGLLDLKGPGFVKYIDGCTDSLLICPPRLGDPCLNALYFPSNTVQTFHTHSSFRAGIVAAGHGVASLRDCEQRLNVGDCFYISENEVHRFKTSSEPMTIVAFHPDSDWGPTDETHPMINKTDILSSQPLLI